MILLLTNSGDGTSDRLAQNLKDQVFRLNFDQLPEFKIRFDLHGWSIENPVGRRITSEDAKTVMWWKAFISSPLKYDHYLKAESKYFFREIYSWFYDYGKVKGNATEFHNKFGKIRICRLASKYFKTPQSLITYQLEGESSVTVENRIVKSLSSEMVAEKKALFTTDVSNKLLDPQYPWFVQEKIKAKSDLTFFVVGKKIFGFERLRSELVGLDWRAEQKFQVDTEEWIPYSYSSEFAKKLANLNADLGIDWGRYDFMLDYQDEIHFLEFNANGQWVFLDFKEKYGLLDTVVDYLKN